MDKRKTMRSRPLLLWEILNSETNAERALTTKELLAELEKRGAPCERRALERDIDALIGMNYPIRKERGLSYRYYLDGRSFDRGEISILLDCVQASAFLTEDLTWKLMLKIAALGGGGKEEIDERAGNILLNSVNKTTNAEVKESVSVIEQAVIGQKKISFRYFDMDQKGGRVYRKNGELYVASPLNKTIKDGFYYLLAKTDNHENLSIYRIDRMSGTALLDEPFDPLEQFSDPSALEQYKKQMFGMYGGKEVRVKLRVHRTLLNMVCDTFDLTETRLTAESADYYSFTCSVIDSPMFIAWCCSYGEKLQVVAPQSYVQKVAQYVQTLSGMYPG